jgi:hypothetical protein
MSQSIDYKTGDRVQVKGFAIFGTCLGIWAEDNMMLFSDEETNELRKYSLNKVCKAYEK